MCLSLACLAILPGGHHVRRGAVVQRRAWNEASIYAFSHIGAVGRQVSL